MPPKQRATVLDAVGDSAVGLLSGTGPSGTVTRPHSYVVSEDPGFFPEGLELTRAGSMYVTSLSTGAVQRGSVRRTHLTPWLEAGDDGRTATAGIREDRWGRLLIAGASTGRLYRYLPDGGLLGVQEVPAPSFLNDVTATDRAVYVTDSIAGIVYTAELGPRRLGPLRPLVGPDDFPMGPFFLNGIAATPDQQFVVVSDEDAGLYRVDLATHDVQAVRVLGAEDVWADGMLLHGRLGCLVNSDADSDGTRLRVVLFDSTWTFAQVVAESPTVGPEQTPSAVALDGRRLLWVNSQIGSTDPTPPFTVTAVPRLVRASRRTRVQ